MRKLRVALLLLFLLWVMRPALPAQASQSPQTSQSTLTLDQQALLDGARRDFGEHHPEIALEKMKRLHAMVSEDRTVTVGTAETAVSVGEDEYALSLLQPWTAAHPDDLLGLELLTRACAETGKTAARDAAIAAVQKAHASGAAQAPDRADRFLAERIRLSSGVLDVYVAFVPFSPYHIYMLGRQADAQGALVRQITLESDDVDQVAFAKEHPDLAAKGDRRFSMDTYSAGVPGPNGTTTQTQALLGFYDGQPSYDEVKARMLRTANGQVPPVASRSGLPVPKSN